METGVHHGVSESEKRRRLSEVYLKLGRRAMTSESATRILDTFEDNDGSLKRLLDEPVMFYREDGKGETFCHLESKFSFLGNSFEWAEMQSDPVAYFESLSYITREDINAD